MCCIKQSGRTSDASWIASPNCDARPAPGFVNSLIIHAISLPPDEFGGAFVEDFFCNNLDKYAHPYFATICDLRVSAHFYITRSGKLVQFVSTKDRAWHAGISNFKGLDKVNDFSIGIELEGCESDIFTDEQYVTLVSLSRRLMRAYPAITLNRIVGHSDIAPGRKTDPGPKFEWNKYRSQLAIDD